MNRKPTLEEMEAAYRRHSLRLDDAAGRRPLPAQQPATRHRLTLTVGDLWRYTAAAAAAAVVLVLLPPSNSLAASPHADRKACTEIIENIIP